MLFKRPIMAKNEALLGVLGNGKKGIYFRGTKAKFLGEQRQYWEQGTLENKFLILGDQGNKPIYFKGTGTPLGGPQK